MVNIIKCNIPLWFIVFNLSKLVCRSLSIDLEHSKHGKLPLITRWLLCRNFPTSGRNIKKSEWIGAWTNKKPTRNRLVSTCLWLLHHGWGRIDEWLNDSKQLGLMESTDYICGVFFVIHYYLDGGFKFCFNHYLKEIPLLKEKIQFDSYCWTSQVQPLTSYCINPMTW